ncbi:MAG: type II toxin-antitoxin system VapC family toxin [Microbacteriaceae bacterium]|nr:type II toxin-antitoxin system VapC family toxin [Burkholderiaceae bacterium]
MNLRLDTPVALWVITDSPKLPSSARQLIAAPRNTVWVSAAAVWEIAIKHSPGHGDMPVSGALALGCFQAAGYRILAVGAAHAVAVAGLAAHHHDPFDRLMIAQALLEPMRLMSHDPMVARYSDTVIKI